MKIKMATIFILVTLLISSLSVSAININTSQNDPTPTIDGCFNSYIGHGEEISEGYAKCYYTYRVKNTLGQTVEIVFDWGDGTTSTSPELNDLTVRYEPHMYAKGGNYQIKARYKIYNSWSEPFEIPMLDHCDLEIIELKTEPESFKKGAEIDIYATVKNVGSIKSTSTSLQFYAGHPDDDVKIEGRKEISALNPEETCTVYIRDFKWYNDEVTHSIWAKVQEIPNERTSLNNIGDGHFTAPKLKMQNYVFNLLERLPIFKKLLG